MHNAIKMYEINKCSHVSYMMRIKNDKHSGYSILQAIVILLGRNNFACVCV